jgi:hypothetical protein
MNVAAQHYITRKPLFPSYASGRLINAATLRSETSTRSREHPTCDMSIWSLSIYREEVARYGLISYHSLLAVSKLNF